MSYTISSYESLTLAHPCPQFGSNPDKARKAYADFVRKELDDSPWKSLNGPDILGDDTFRGQLQGESTKIPVGITKRKALLRHLPLSEIARKDRLRGEWMREAYREHGYTMQEIGEFAGLHHSTVGRLIKMEDKNVRN